MRVLVLGAGGFIGRHIAAALEWHGHAVVQGVSARGAARQVAASAQRHLVVDFARDTAAAAWLPRLEGIDAVVNAVGVLRNTRARPMQAVHTGAPLALFEACGRAGVRRVVHVSALGIDANPSGYAATKRAAEAGLLAHLGAGRLAGTLVRPSVVFGQGGESSALFLNLARLPLAILPAVAWRVRVQPIHVLELAEGVARLLGPAASGPPGAADQPPRVLEAVGPAPVRLAGFIASLRAQQGHAPARTWPLPDGLTRWSARLGDRVPVTPWGSEALSLLSHDNIGDAGPIGALLGRAPTHYSRLLACEPPASQGRPAA